MTIPQPHVAVYIPKKEGILNLSYMGKFLEPQQKCAAVHEIKPRQLVCTTHGAICKHKWSLFGIPPYLATIRVSDL